MCKIWVYDKDSYLPTKIVGKKYKHTVKNVITPLSTATQASA